MKIPYLLSSAAISSGLFSVGLTAATYTATTTISDWNDPALWGAPQMAGNDFVFAPAASFNRVDAKSASFAGDSLTIKGTLSTGSFNIAQDLTFEAYGTFSNGAHNTVHTGTWTIVDNGIFLARRPKSTLNVTFLGEGTFWIGDDLTTKSTVVLAANSGNTFTGTLVFGTPGDDDVVNVEFSGDVSAPDLTLKIESTDANGTLEYSQLKLNYTIAVGAVELDGVALDPGVYSFSDLSSGQQLYFIDGGGQLVVSPPDAPTGTIIEVSALGADASQPAG